MAFGKNPNNLNNVGTYGQPSLGQQSGSTSRKGGRGGGGRSRRPYWAGNFEISENPAQPDRVRLLRGDYVQDVLVDGPQGETLITSSYPYVMMREHFHAGKNRGALCSAGPYHMSREHKSPCNGCSFFWSEQDAVSAAKARGALHSRAMSMTDKFAFSLFDYAYYFDVPQTDRNGQFRMNNKTNQPYTDWVKAANPQDPAYAGYPWKEGNTVPLLIGKQYRDVLLGYSEVVGNHCVSCGNQNCIRSVGWYCSNPQCYALLHDSSQGLSKEQHAAFNGLHACGSCQMVVYPQEVVACQHCAAGKRASLFDVDLYMFRMRTSDGKTQLMITGTSPPGPIKLQTGDASAIVPLDLLKTFAPSDIAEQLEMWGPPPTASTGTGLPQVQAPMMPQPITRAPVPPPQPAAPVLGMPAFTPPAAAHPPGAPGVPGGFYQPQMAPPQVDPMDITRQLAEMAKTPF